jgi:hypothetical protein
MRYKYSTKSLTAFWLSWLCLSFTAAAQPAQTGPDWKIREGLNELSLYERFSMTIQHTAKIRRVLYDDEVITVTTIEGDPQSFQIYAAKACVTTITVIDEFDKHFELEVLVRGDVRHLESFIRRLYPDDTIGVEEISDSSVRLHGNCRAVLSGRVESYAGRWCAADHAEVHSDGGAAFEAAASGNEFYAGAAGWIFVEHTWSDRALDRGTCWQRIYSWHQCPQRQLCHLGINSAIG